MKLFKKVLSSFLVLAMIFTSSSFSGLMLYDVYAATHTATAAFYLDGAYVGTATVSVQDGADLSVSSFALPDDVIDAEWAGGTYSYTTSEEITVASGSTTSTINGGENTASYVLTTELSTTLSSSGVYDYSVSYANIWTTNDIYLVLSTGSTASSSNSVTVAHVATVSEWATTTKTVTGTLDLSSVSNLSDYEYIAILLKPSSGSWSGMDAGNGISFTVTGTDTNEVTGEFTSSDDTLTVIQSAGDYELAYYYTSSAYDVTVRYWLITYDEENDYAERLVELEEHGSPEIFEGIAGGSVISLSIPDKADDAKFAYYTVTDNDAQTTSEKITEWTTLQTVTGNTTYDYYFYSIYLLQLPNTQFELNSLYGWDLDITNASDDSVGYIFQSLDIKQSTDPQTTEVISIWNNNPATESYTLEYEIEGLEAGYYRIDMSVYGSVTNAGTLTANGASESTTATIDPAGWDDELEQWQDVSVYFVVSEADDGATVTVTLSGNLSQYDWLYVWGFVCYQINDEPTAAEDDVTEYEIVYFDSTLYNYDLDKYNAAADAAAEAESDGSTTTTDVVVAQNSASSLNNNGSSSTYYALMTELSSTLSGSGNYTYSVSYNGIWQTATIYLVLATDSSGSNSVTIATVATVTQWNETTQTATGTANISSVSNLSNYNYVGLMIVRSGNTWVGSNGEVSFKLTGTVTDSSATQPIYMVDSSWIEEGDTVVSDGDDTYVIGDKTLYDWNIWTGWDLTGDTVTESDESGVYSGLASSTLDVDGNISFNYPEGGLFDSDTIVKDIFTDVGMPYIWDGTYYTFDSDLYDVYWSDDEGPTSESTLDINFDKKIMGSKVDGYQYKGFFPFDGESDTQATYNFGMHTQVSFYLTEDGDIAGTTNDMIFEFHGDDDVWVYVDGILVLDIGGIHSAISATIDFSTDYDSDGMTATVGGQATAFGNIEGLLEKLGYDETTNKYDVETEHTIDIFYLERGQQESNSYIRFNLTPLNTLTIEKNVSDTLLELLGDDAEFTFYLEKYDEGTDEWNKLVGSYEYTLYHADGTHITGCYTDADGTFKIKNGEQAVFIAASGLGLIEGEVFRAVEDTSAYEDYNMSTSWEATSGYDSTYTSGTKSEDKLVDYNITKGETVLAINNESFNETILSPWTESFIDTSTFSAGPTYDLLYDEETDTYTGRDYYFRIANEGSSVAEYGYLKRQLTNVDITTTNVYGETVDIVYTVTIAIRSNTLGNTGLVLSANGVSTNVVAYATDEYETYQLTGVVPNEDGLITVTLDGNLAAGYTISVDDLKITANTGEKLEGADYTLICYNMIEANLSDDTIVIDYGKSVSVDVLDNDTIEDTKQAYISWADAVDSNKDSLGYANSYAKYGRYTYSADTIKYTPTSYLNGVERIQYGVGTYTTDINAILAIIPATTVYYEDDFGYSTTGSGIVYTGNWSTIGTSSTADTYQNTDYVGSEDANNYGYDEAYDSDATFSAGSAHVVDGDSQTTTASFTFSGTGFDIISRTDTGTGMVVVRVYDADGNRVAVIPVINTRVSSTALYQIPVINWSTETYGTYTVEITVSAANYFTSATTFYLDAIRIYNPVDVSDGSVDADEAAAAYEADGEANAKIEELRNLVINADSFNSNNSGDVDGIVYLDSVEGYDGSSVSDYATIGPNNELYLSGGSAIAFNFSADDSLATVHIGSKSPTGSAILKVVDVAADGSYEVYTKTLSTATDMYYDITEYCESGHTIIIMNSSADTGSVLSLTNVKMTYRDTAKVASEAALLSLYSFRVSADTLSTVTGTLADILSDEEYDADSEPADDDADVIEFNEETNSITIPEGYSTENIPTEIREGYIFAGWYTDEDCTDIYTADTADEETTLYARWIDENVLSVKAQIVAGTTEESDSTTVRFISTVDTLDYSQSGFIISYTKDGTEYETAVSVTKVYSAIKANGQALSANVFSPDSEYFTAYALRNIPNAYFDTEITVTPYVVNEAGATIYGIARTLTVNEILASSSESGR